MRAKPIAALAACELASLAVTRSASMHFALRAALQLRKTAVLPFCHSTHSHCYGHFYEHGRKKRRDPNSQAPSIRDPCVNCGLKERIGAPTTEATASNEGVSFTRSGRFPICSLANLTPQA